MLIVNEHNNFLSTPIDWSLAKSQEEGFLIVNHCDDCKFSQTSATKKLSEHQRQQLTPMAKAPTSGTIIVLFDQSLKFTLRKKACHLHKNILPQIHKCSVLQFGCKGKYFKSATAIL